LADDFLRFVREILHRSSPSQPEDTILPKDIQANYAVRIVIRKHRFDGAFFVRRILARQGPSNRLAPMDYGVSCFSRGYPAGTLTVSNLSTRSLVIKVS